MKKYIVLLAAAICTTACSDLEENPVGLLAPESFFKTPADLQASANGSFAYMASEKYWGRQLSMSLLLRGDMAQIGDLTTTPARVEVDQFRMNDGSEIVSAFWPQSYAIIGAANQTIAGAAKVTGDPNTINAIAAQAYFSRAFAYYHLVRLFGAIPYIDFAVTDISAVNTISKTSEADVYTKIIADLKYAKEWLPNKQPVRSLPSKATAAAYLASVYLTLGENQKAYDEAKFVIEKESLFGLDLDANFQDLFDSSKALTLKEPLFTIDFIGQSRVNDLGQDYLASVTGIRGDQTFSFGEGWSVAVPSLKVFSDWNQRDYRRAVSFDTIGKKGTTTYDYTKFTTMSSRAVNRPHIAKYFRKIGLAGLNGRESSSNYIMMRYAEVLLIAAEALNEVSPILGNAEATSYVNRIRARARNRAGVPSNYPANELLGLSQTDFRKMVLRERRLELAFEFGRWYDIKRLKIGVEAFGTNGLEQQVFNPNKDYFFPLPGRELEKNTNLKPNNPGY